VWFSLSSAESWVHAGGGVVCQECEGEEERHHHPCNQFMTSRTVEVAMAFNMKGVAWE